MSGSSSTSEIPDLQDLLNRCKKAAEIIPQGNLYSIISSSGESHAAESLVVLARHYPAHFEGAFRQIIDSAPILQMTPYGRLAEAFIAAAERPSEERKRIYAYVLDAPDRLGSAPPFDRIRFSQICQDAMTGLLNSHPHVPAGEIRSWLHDTLARIRPLPKRFNWQDGALESIWKTAMEGANEAVLEDALELLSSPGKANRRLAITGLERCPAEKVLPAVAEKLASSRSDDRIGAAEFLAHRGEASSVELLQQALEREKAPKVRICLLEALNACGAPAPVVEQEDQTLEQLEASYQTLGKRLKQPPAKWLNLAKLPPLVTPACTPLSTLAVTFLLSRQAAGKEIKPVADIQPLLNHLDRTASAPFAASLVDGFLHSEQNASDRWALALGGILGDSRIIPPLLSRIPGWCENARHKLAEYAAQAISLLPGNEPLMVLDTLANRYRSKFKNVGKACSDAFLAAAQARGITAEELGDMVVPSFDFDSDGIRRFEWDGGGASAELGPDFKLTWFDPETEKSWKALPAGAPESVKNEVKTLTKMLRETVKAQTPRLEMAMVRQRRWTAERWRELYESHPLLRSFASRLVWGVYDASGHLIRSFRRYPNGLLANAEGALEELAETQVFIGIVHPLEMDANAVAAWKAHLIRFKIAPPFPQIDRPVEMSDPLHGNRREISLTHDRKISAGTFRSRCEKRGWVRGSVIDGGAVACFYKIYPGAGIEVILPVDGFWIGCEPTEELTLGSAYFVKGGTAEEFGYVQDLLKKDDPRVLRFEAIPPVVWSETIADLKAILGT